MSAQKPIAKGQIMHLGSERFMIFKAETTAGGRATVEVVLEPISKKIKDDPYYAQEILLNFNFSIMRFEGPTNNRIVVRKSTSQLRKLLGLK